MEISQHKYSEGRHEIKKALLLVCLVFSIHFMASGQATFNTNTALPVDLDLGTNYTNCGSPGTKAFTFEVECVGVLNNVDLQLAEINFTLSAACGGNLRDIACWIKSPAGTCVQIASTLGTTTNYTVNPTNRIDYTFRNGASCLNKTPDYAAFPANVPAASNLNGRYGIFSTIGNLRTAFIGEDADGIWTIYFSETASAAPCVTSASIVFGDAVSRDRRNEGDQCVSAIEWIGDPICVSTTGKTPSPNSPGFNGTYAGCAWNNSNDNNVWIVFTPIASNVCLSISGLSGDLQSIIVTDPNADGDNNPCTGANGGRYWTVVSCPRTNDQIYAAVTGTTRNHNHCFTATPGVRYYLVVDGNAGAQSEFYINGTLGFEYNLPIKCPASQTVCASDAPFALSGGVPDGGTYSGVGVSNNVFNPSAAGVGVHVITYLYLNACDTVSCTFNITVELSETPLFNPFPDICAGDIAPVLPAISINGIPGTWSPAVVSNTVTGTYIFTPSLPCVESVSVTINVSSGGAPVFAWNAYPAGAVGANAFTNSQGSCSMTASISGTEWVNAANNATPPTAPYYTTAVGTGLHLRHNWTSTNPNPTTTLTLNFSPPINDPSFTLFDINRNGANAICVNLWTDKVTVSGFSNATPILPAFTQVNPAHQTITQVGNSLLMVGNETSFNDVNVNFNGAITRIVITYTSESTISSSVGCPAGSGNPTTQFITVGSIRGAAVPAPTGITGNTVLCQGESTTLTLSGGTSTSEWFAGACGGVSAGTGNTITVSPSSTTTYFASNSNCGCNTSCVSQTVTVNPPVIPQFSIPDICVGDTPPALPLVSDNGIVGTWNPSTVNNNNSGTYTFTPNPNQCASPVSITITAFPSPSTSPIFRD
jgi:hypothetical protein